MDSEQGLVREAVGEPVGHVYLVGEPIVFGFRTAGRHIAWRVEDGWGMQVAQGETRPIDGRVRLELPALPVGWHALDVVARDSERELARQRLHLAVVTPYDLATVDESPFGVMTHFAQAWQPDLIEPLARAGIKHVRDEVYWASVEQEPGRFDFPDKFETYMRALARHHMTPLTPMTFGNPLNWDVPGVPTWAAAPYRPEQIAAYARYCQAVLEHYGRQVRAVEIWNEYNGGFARGPADGRPEVYRQMLKEAYRAIKQVRPDVQVLGGATIGVPLDWIETVLQDGGIDHLDAVSIHPYGYEHAPEQLAPLLQSLRELIRRHNHGRDKPLWVTEQGWYLTEPGSRGNRDAITEHTKARYLARAWALFLANGVEKSFWYLGRNDQAFGTMGLVGKPDDPAGRYAPLPALSAYAALVRALDGAQFEAQEPTPDPGIYSIRFRRGDEVVRVMWSTGGGLVDVGLRADGPLEVTDLMGVTTEVHPVGGRVLLGLSDAPLHVRGQVDGIERRQRPLAAVPGEVAVGSALAVRFDVSCLPAGTITLIQAAGLEASLDTGEAGVEVPASDASAECWTPIRAHSGERVVYLAYAKSLGRPPVWLDPFPRPNPAGELEVLVRHTPESPAPRITAAHLELDGQHLRITPAQADRIIFTGSTMPPFAIRRAKVRVEVEDGAPLEIEAEVSFNPVMRRTMTIDGDLSDWDGLPMIDLDHAPYHKLLADRRDARDLGGWCRLAWDDQHLYLAAAVTDDVFDQTHHGYGTWKGDSIQIALSAMMPWTGGEWPMRWHEIGLALTPGGPEVFRSAGPHGSGLIRGARLAVRRAGEVTNYECALPWPEIDPSLPAAGRLAFGLYLNDADGDGRKGFIQWANIKRLSQMQPLFLVDR